MVAEVNAQAAAGWKVPAIFMSFTAICMLLLMGVALLHFGDVLFSRRARGWIFRTYTQIAQEIYPETISFIGEPHFPPTCQLHDSRYSQDGVFSWSFLVVGQLAIPCRDDFCCANVLELVRQSSMVLQR